MATIIGIDLGTSNTVVSVASEGTNGIVDVETHKMSQMSADGMGFEEDACLPSVVYIENGDVTVGKFAKGMQGQNTARVISNSKNFIGQSGYSWRIDKIEYTPEVVASYFLNAVRKYLNSRYPYEEMRNSPVVITVPASFNMDQRNATKMAAQLAGFNAEVTLIAEPTAALLDFINEQLKLEETYLELSEYKNILIFDLGGGTTDVAILKVRVSGREVYLEELAVSPHTLLGGNDFDVYAMKGILADYEATYQVKLSEVMESEALFRLEARLLVLAEKAKIYFTDKYNANKKDTSIKFPINIGEDVQGKPFKYTLTLEKYNEFIDALFKVEHGKNVFQPIEAALHDAHMTTTAIDYVFTVGGMTKFPTIIERLEQYFNKEVYRYCDSMLSVSRGAAVYQYYEIKQPTKDNVSNDVKIDIIPTLPQSIFLNVKNDFPQVLIEAKTKANTPIIYEDLLQTTSSLGITLQLYCGRSFYDPQLKALNDINITFPYAVPIGSKLSLEIVYTDKGVVEFKAWIKAYPEIKVTICIQGEYLSQSELVRRQRKYGLLNVKGVI